MLRSSASGAGRIRRLGGTAMRIVMAVVAVVGVAAVLLGSAAACGTRPAGGGTPAAGVQASAGAARHSGLPTVQAGQLPAEARHTLDLIDRGGPFPYRLDGIVFGNREQLLPREPSGYYREYTVPTPGEGDRGARRIVAGEQGERYYSADHYRSFREVLP